MRMSAGLTTTGVGTTLQPVMGVLATATVRPKLREVAIYNKSNVACTYELVQITGGTPGATISAYDQEEGGNTRTPACTAKGLWTVNGTVIKTGYRAELGAADGSSVILAFGGQGLTCVYGATVGLGLVPIGTGQLLEVYMVWDE